MNQLFQDSVFFGVLISLAAYGIGMLLKLKTGWSLMNPLLISIILVIITLLLTGVDYKTYSAGANSISYLLTPATICLAVPLYQQVELLKKNYRAVLIGIVSGVLASLCSVLILAFILPFRSIAVLAVTLAFVLTEPSLPPSVSAFLRSWAVMFRFRWLSSS